MTAPPTSVDSSANASANASSDTSPDRHWTAPPRDAIDSAIGVLDHAESAQTSMRKTLLAILRDEALDHLENRPRMGTLKCVRSPGELLDGQHGCAVPDGASPPWRCTILLSTSSGDVRDRIELGREASECVRESLARHPRQYLFVNARSRKALYKGAWDAWFDDVCAHLYRDPSRSVVRNERRASSEDVPWAWTMVDESESKRTCGGRSRAQRDQTPCAPDAVVESSANAGVDVATRAIVRGIADGASPMPEHLITGTGVPSSVRDVVFPLRDALATVCSRAKTVDDGDGSASRDDSNETRAIGREASVTYSKLTWSNLGNTGPSNVIDLSRVHGVLAVAGDASRACAIAASTAISGCGKEDLARSRMTRQAIARVNRSAKARVDLWFTMRPSDDGKNTCDVTDDVAGSYHLFRSAELRRGQGLKFQQQVLERDGEVVEGTPRRGRGNGTEMREWFREGVTLPRAMFDVDDALGALSTHAQDEEAVRSDRDRPVQRPRSDEDEGLIDAISDAIRVHASARSKLRTMAGAPTTRGASKSQSKKARLLRRGAREALASLESMGREWIDAGRSRDRSDGSIRDRVARAILASEHDDDGLHRQGTLLGRATAMLTEGLKEEHDVRLELVDGTLHLARADGRSDPVHDLSLSRYYACAAAAHAALCEAGVAGFDESHIFVDELPLSSQSHVRSVFCAMVHRNPSRSVIMAATDDRILADPDAHVLNTTCAEDGSGDLPRISIPAASETGACLETETSR